MGYSPVAKIFYGQSILFEKSVFFPSEFDDELTLGAPIELVRSGFMNSDTEYALAVSETIQSFYHYNIVELITSRFKKFEEKIPQYNGWFTKVCQHYNLVPDGEPTWLVSVRYS